MERFKSYHIIKDKGPGWFMFLRGGKRDIEILEDLILKPNFVCEYRVNKNSCFNVYIDKTKKNKEF